MITPRKTSTRPGRLRAVFFALAAMVAATVGGADAGAAEARLGRGINILSTDGLFIPGSGTSFSFATLGRLKALGFDHVRINALPFARIDAGGRLEERWIRTLRRVIDASLASGLKVVVDVHEFLFCQRDARACEAKLDITWATLADRLADYDDRVAFEILNEPGGAMDVATWNRVLAKQLATIRRLNPRRPVVIGPAEGNAPSALPRLRLPSEDRNLLIGVHYYDPFAFTHQGAPWAGLGAATGVDWGSEADVARLDADFDAIFTWARAEKREIYLGEFGVYDRAEVRPRFCWLHRVARAAEQRGWSWAYWQLTSDFALMEERSGRWNDWIVAALMLPADPAVCRPPTPGVLTRPD
jgi:endoglucanase